MTLRTRLSIIAALVAIFLILAPIIIYYALGYRYDLKNHVFVKTGTLMIRSEPKGAKVFIDAEFTGKHTPATIRFLDRGEYDVSLELDGYKTWQKRLSVQPEQITLGAPNNEKIFLYLVSPLKELAATSTSAVLPSPNDFFLLRAASMIYLSDSDGRTIVTTGLAKSDSASASLSQNANWLFLDLQKNSFWAFNLENGQRLPFSKSGLKLVKVDSLGSGNLISLDSEGRLYQYSSQGGKSIIRAQNVTAFAAEAERLLYLQNGSLIETDQASTTKTVLLDNLPAFSSSEIILTDSGRVFLLLDGSVYQPADYPTAIETDVEKMAWYENSQKLLLYNPNTLWILDPGVSKKTELITRSSEPILYPAYHADSNTIFFVQGNKVKAIESYFGAGDRAIIELFDANEPITDLYLDPGGEILYYLTKSGDLFSLRVR